MFFFFFFFFAFDLHPLVLSTRAENQNHCTQIRHSLCIEALSGFQRQGERAFISGNRGTQAKFWGEQGNKDDTREQGTKENHFSGTGELANLFLGKKVTGIPFEGLGIYNTIIE